MPDPNDPLALLAQQVDETAKTVAALTPEQASLSTPCLGWTVARLVNHVIDDLANFTVAAEGGTPDWEATPSTVPPSAWADLVRDESQELMAAWSEAPANARTGVDMQLVELALHRWDLCKASGLPITIDPDVATRGLAWGRANLKPEHRGAPGGAEGFAQEVAVADEAPAADRLVGWSGRDPQWSPPASTA